MLLFNKSIYFEFLLLKIFPLKSAISMLRLLVRANVPISPILVTLMMVAIRSSEKQFLTRATRRHIQEDGILQ
jgi:hypothetical protein